MITNEYDFGFVGGHLVADDVVGLPWRTDEIVLIVPPNHALARRKLVRLNDLAGQEFVFRERGSATRAAVEEKLRALNLKQEPVMEMDNQEAVKHALQGGLGVAFLSKFAVEAELKVGTLVVLKVSGLSIKRDLKITQRRDKHLGRAARAFIEMAQNSGD